MSSSIESDMLKVFVVLFKECDVVGNMDLVGIFEPLKWLDLKMGTFGADLIKMVEGGRQGFTTIIVGIDPLSEVFMLWASIICGSDNVVSKWHLQQCVTGRKSSLLVCGPELFVIVQAQQNLLWGDHLNQAMKNLMAFNLHNVKLGWAFAKEFSGRHSKDQGRGFEKG
ncbi:hypothetical protein ARMGADRAFT_1025550 [Armillaria gallica]|uniref:Uncharacterized protein n=1 Tax=Armillaria gallica TaxID=47427 RepID=A0A2H3E6G7_ARMGA|nr:hypothetical protein ARMGADRAFT_1025550 [Armillaria gallica]